MTALNQPNQPSGNSIRLQQRFQEIRRQMAHSGQTLEDEPMANALDFLIEQFQPSEDPEKPSYAEEPEPASPPALHTLADPALYGLAGNIVRSLAPHTEADPAAILLQLLAAFGNLELKSLSLVSHHMEPTGTRPATRWTDIKTGQRGDN